MKVAILHQLPIEYYPPLTNILKYFSDVQDVQVLAVTCHNDKGRAPYSQPRIELRRYPFAVRGDSFYQRWKKAFAWHWAAARTLADFRPDVLMYFEPHSALAAFLYFWWFRGKARLFIHHHEYYTPGDYRQPGNRLTRLNHFFERRFLLPRAYWISQTNSDRLRFFQSDHPEVETQKLHVMPNLPPQRWLQREAVQNQFATPTLRLVYVGSVSLHDTFIGPLVDWLLANPALAISLDVFAYNCDPVTLEFLKKSSGETVRFHERGVDYDELPTLLRQFDVGVILYRCRTVNYQYNASNKLFEYLTCGLDVWYPPTMLGVKPYARDDAWPRVMEIDYDELTSVDLSKMRSRDGLRELAWQETCEGVYSVLDAAMRESLSKESEISV